MPIITISRGSYSYGKEIAEKVAQKLGYECIDREVLLEASKEFNVPQIKLIHVIRDAPSILERFTHGKEKYIAFIQAAILEHFQKDNVVYHGLAGHFFVKGISHVLKVRIIVDLENRIRVVMARDKISRNDAQHFIEKIDNERRHWSKHLYGIDSWDSSLYDLVIHIHKITIDDAVDIICHTAGLKDFQTTPESRKAMDDLVLSAQVKAALIDVNLEIKVSVQDGVVFVETEAPILQEHALIRDIERISKNVPGVKEVKSKVLPPGPYSPRYTD
ncbi:MAG: cytidylate kinase family protein [Proteobacteria bacterium]|nr:cytidylate kinase family protein [Pseudomonadota bacterium]